jgi:16S rRNA A1518/A1519 N6-dimethyltransferase RsmA/KsgA/DIM1 with predicted DNA glycosylase/AP lyase activity
VLELEPRYCERLRRELPGSVTVVQGDATAMPFADASQSASSFRFRAFKLAAAAR